MVRFFKDIKKFRNYVIYSTRAELKAEVAGSFLSWLWWFLDPLLYMMVYSFIALLIFQSGEPHFPVFVFLGINCWQFFSKSVKSSVRLIVANKSVVTKVYIPKHMFLLEKLGVHAFKMFVSYGLTVLFLAGEALLNTLFGIGDPVNIGIKIFWVIPLMALLFLFTFAVCLIMTHFGVFVEDLNNVIVVVLQLAFYVSGVFYSLETRISKVNFAFPFVNNIPCFESSKEAWVFLGQTLTNLNPLALIMSDMRYAVLGNGTGFHLAAFAFWFILSALVAIFGIRLIYKYENSYVKII